MENQSSKKFLLKATPLLGIEPWLHLHLFAAWPSISLDPQREKDKCSEMSLWGRHIPFSLPQWFYCWWKFKTKILEDYRNSCFLLFFKNYYFTLQYCIGFAIQWLSFKFYYHCEIWEFCLHLIFPLYLNISNPLIGRIWLPLRFKGITPNELMETDWNWLQCLVIYFNEKKMCVSLKDSVI